MTVNTIFLYIYKDLNISHFTILMYFWFDNYETKWSANKTSGEKIN